MNAADAKDELNTREEEEGVNYRSCDLQGGEGGFRLHL